MKVRELTCALEQHDPEIDVVIPADPELEIWLCSRKNGGHDILARIFNGGVELAELQDQGARVVLRPYGEGVEPEVVSTGRWTTDRARFFLDWYDGLMNFAGTDHVDHWMRTVN